MGRRIVRRSARRRGRRSFKKDMRAVFILFAVSVIGSISGGVGTVSASKNVKTGAANNTNVLPWLALMVLCVLLGIVVIYLYRKRYTDRAERINGSIRRYLELYNEVRSTSDVATYIRAMEEMNHLGKSIINRTEELPNWAKSDLMVITPEQKNAKNNFQWWLRDVIDRAKTEAVKNCKGIYKNSNNGRERTYWDFINNIYVGSRYFDSETVDAANAAALAVYRASGSFFTPRAPFVLETSDRPTGEVKKGLESQLLSVDSMDGREFERFCAMLLQKNGFTKVQLTQASGDQGVDILAEKGGVQYAIQCKCYSSDLGNTPVQEVNAGRMIYGRHVGVVMTNRYFTRGAKEAAAQTNVLLWDRDTMKDFMRNI